MLSRTFGDREASEKKKGSDARRCKTVRMFREGTATGQVAEYRLI